MKSWINCICVLVLLCLSASGCSLFVAEQTHVRTIQFGTHKLTVEVADNDPLRAQGLMYRSSLQSDHGMLFTLDWREPFLCFWMKNTAIPLDIAFFNHTKQISEIYTMKPLDETPVCPRRRSWAALEVNAGWFEQNGIKVGDSFDYAD